MPGRISQHLRSNLVGYIALFVAMSGVAYAADGPLAGQNKVGSADIIDGEVKGADLGADSVSTGRIIDGGVRKLDLGPSSVVGGPGGTVADNSITGADVGLDKLGANDISGIQTLATKDTSINDPTSGGATRTTLLHNPGGFPYDIIGECIKFPDGGVGADVFYRGSASNVVAAVDSTAPGGNNSPSYPGGGVNELRLASLNPELEPRWEAGSYSIRGYNSDDGSVFRAISGEVALGTKAGAPGQDCVFAVTAIG